MWTVEDDLLKIGGNGSTASLDTCCNLNVMLSLRESAAAADLSNQNLTVREKAARWGKTSYELDLTVTNRSNDLCLAGETKFRSPEGEISIALLALKFQLYKGYKFPVYAVDTRTGDQRLCWMTNAWKTGVKPVVKLGFDDGSFIRVTGDHVLFKKTKVFDGKRCVGLKVEERQACELKIGDRVLADIHQSSPCRNGGYRFFKRNLFKNTHFRNMVHEHRHYWEFVTGRKLGSDEIHHKDEVKTNNTFDNLERLTKQEHRSYHLKKDNPNGKMTTEQVFERASKGGKTHKGKAKSKSHRDAISKAAKLRYKLGKRKKDDLDRYMSNHKIISIEADGTTTVYDFTVPGRHNAVLENGVLVHNCWGLLGANYVTFSVLQEYLAARLGVAVGRYHHFTNNLHVYDWNFKPEEWLRSRNVRNPYQSMDEFNSAWAKHPAGDRPFSQIPLVADPDRFEVELPVFVQNHASPDPSKVQTAYQEPFLRDVADPLLKVFHSRKAPGWDHWRKWAKLIKADDWRIAATSWVERRERREERARAKD
jgi:hypothetical protein